MKKKSIFPSQYTFFRERERATKKKFKKIKNSKNTHNIFMV